MTHSRHSPWRRSNPGMFWRRILSRGKNDAAGLRRWQLWIWWAKPRSTVDWLITFRNLATFPLDIFIAAYRMSRHYGNSVKQEHQISVFRQIVDMMLLRVKSNIPYHLYYQLQLFLPEKRSFASQFFFETGKLFHVLAERHNQIPGFSVLSDKSQFEIWCNENHLPSAKTLVEFNNGGIIKHTANPLPAVDLLSKPTNWEGGKGVQHWRYVLNGINSFWTNGSTVAESEEELEACVASFAHKYNRPFILQPFLVNHPTIHAMGNGALCTLRIMTLCDNKGLTEPLLAVLRIPTGSSATDNFDTGGLAAAVDLNTAVCDKAVYKKDRYPPVRLENHPDTNSPIAGQTIPYLQESLDLCTRAHNVLPLHWPAIGWDVAILEDGPVFIEVNYMPCPALAQLPTGIPLGTTRLVDCLLGQMRISFNVA